MKTRRALRLSMTGRLLGTRRALLLAVALAALSGCALTPLTPPQPEQDTAATWDKARRFIPPKAENPPVVVFLHGCSGFTNDNYVWGQVLSRAGFLVIMPNSYARFDRTPNCDWRTYTGGSNGQVSLFRREEIRYALQQVKAMQPSPPKVFLMGHSEGGIATGAWFGGGFDGYVLSGTTCRVSNLPSEAPTLIVGHESDPWFRDLTWDICEERAGGRPNTRLHRVAGHGHDSARDRRVQKEVVEFLKRLAQ
jgi:dienelactone hydrolase